MTPTALLLHLLAIPALAMYLLFAVPAEGWRHVWKRLPLFVLLWLAFTLLTLLHVAGHLLDEVLFWRYRKIVVRRPVFILGIPRSGTTYLQRLLGNDDRFVTFTTWEVIFAPSIVEKILFRTLGWLLRPLQECVIAIRRKLFHRMDDIHRIRLHAPEEDFLLLLPLLGCLLLAFACPRSRHFWRLGGFDGNMPAWYKKTVMTFYHRCVQKHLFYHGGDLQFLSKNPSFTPLMDSLLDTFPDARIIACTRAPAEVLPSQLSSLGPAMALLGSGKLSPGTQHRMIDLLHHYYAKLATYRLDPRVHFLPMTALQSDLRLSMSKLFAFLAQEQSAALVQHIDDQLSTCRHTSRHHYSLAEFSLTESLIEEKFREVWTVLSTAQEQESQPD